MEPVTLQVHSVYGAIYKSGEFIQRGAVLGLSPDGSEVVVAPVSGWVCLAERPPAAPPTDSANVLVVEICRTQLCPAVTDSSPGLAVVSK